MIEIPLNGYGFFNFDYFFTWSLSLYCLSQLRQTHGLRDAIAY